MRNSDFCPCLCYQLAVWATVQPGLLPKLKHLPNHGLHLNTTTQPEAQHRTLASREIYPTIDHCPPGCFWPTKDLCSNRDFSKAADFWDTLLLDQLEASAQPLVLHTQGFWHWVAAVPYFHLQLALICSPLKQHEICEKTLFHMWVFSVRALSHQSYHTNHTFHSFISIQIH